MRSDAKAFDWRRYWCLFVVVSIPSGHICRHMCVFRLCFSVVSAVRCSVWAIGECYFRVMWFDAEMVFVLMAFSFYFCCWRIMFECQENCYYHLENYKGWWFLM